MDVDKLPVKSCTRHVCKQTKCHKHTSTTQYVEIFCNKFWQFLLWDLRNIFWNLRNTNYVPISLILVKFHQIGQYLILFQVLYCLQLYFQQWVYFDTRDQQE